MDGRDTEGGFFEYVKKNLNGIESGEDGDVVFNSALTDLVTVGNTACGMNVLGIAKKIAGFTHDDCIPFSGDSTEWVPQFKNGRKIDELSGKTLVFEICFTDGKIYSISGNCTDLFNTEGARYRKFGILPKSK